MSKKDNQKNPLKKDTTTDFFLKFITREKEDSKDEDNLVNRSVNDSIKVKDKAFEWFYYLINSLNAFLDKMLQSNFSMKILSFVMAVILLFTITGGIDNIFSTPNSGDYLYNVPITVEGLQGDYDVVGLPDKVNVALVGPSLDIYSTKISKNYKVVADFSTLGEGEHTIELRGVDFPTDLQVMVVPQTVTVKITQKVTKTFELGYDFINENTIDSKYSVSVESMEHKEVEVRGSQDNIDKIKSVKAVIDLKGKNKDFEQKAKIYAYDRSGKKVDVEIIPNSVKVECMVSSYSKEVLIVPQYTGNFASGYGLESIKLGKEKVRIYGKEELLNSITSVGVVIDLSGLSGDKSYTNLPIVGIENINKLEFDTIDASIRVGPSTKKVISDIPINIVNNNNGYQVRFSDGQDKATVEVDGVGAILDTLTINDFNISIDLENLKTGTNTVKVDLLIDKGYLSGKLISPERITINLRK